MNHRPLLSDLAARVRKEHLTYLAEDRLGRLEEAMADVVRRAVPGLFVETGLGLGGSAIVIVSHLPTGAAFRGYDLFERIPRPHLRRDGLKAWLRHALIRSGLSRGIGGRPYYGYRKDLFRDVSETLAAWGAPVDGTRVRLYRGLFEDVLRFLPEDRVAFAHVDCDWFDSVRTCLARLHPVLSAGGSVVVDDYRDYAGCRAAADAFLAEHPGAYTVVADAPTLWLRRN